MTRITHVEPGLYVNMSNEDYHRAPGISKSGLDMVAVNPSSYQWYLKAPSDSEKLKALDMGTAIHCMLLEPDRFAAEYASDYKDPDNALVTVDHIKNHLDGLGVEYAKSSSKGKLEELVISVDPEAPISSVLRERWQQGLKDKTVVTAEEWRKLHIMRDSVMAHPMARWLLEQESFRECSLFAEDEETGELLKVRPDDKLNQYPFLVDVKKVDQFDRIAAKVEELRYHVQAAIYCFVYHLIYGVWPKFYFLLVGSTISAGKYPVDVIELEPDWMEVGHELFRRDLNVYHYCKSNDSWLHVRKLNRPGWAKRKTA